MACGGGAGADRRPVPRLQPLGVQEPAVLRRRRGAHRDRRARHGASRRPDPSHAADRLRVPRRLRRDLGAAAAQRLRLRMADLPGDPAQPAAAVHGASSSSCRRSARCWRFRRRSPPPASSRPSASPFSAAPRTPAAEQRAGDRPVLARRHVLPRGALPGRRHPARLLHRRAGAGGAGARRRPHAGADAASTGCRSCRSPRAAAPTTACSSSCSWPLSGIARRLRDPPPRLATDCAARRPGTAAIPIRARRRSTPRTASRSRSAACSAPSCSAPASTSTCRRPATPGRRGSTVNLRDLVWDVLYAPIAGGVGCRRRPAQPSAVPDHPPAILSLVFAALVLLLLVLAIWP